MSIFSYYYFRLFWALSKYNRNFLHLLRFLRFFTSPPTHRSMNLFAEAIEDYYCNSMKSKYMYYRSTIQKKYDGLNKEFDLGIYFRTFDNFYPLEKKLIDLSYGNILDIGSCTGYFVPYLMKKGTVTGIEISPKLNNFARKRGIYNCITGDFLTHNFKKKFDTITLIGNDLALSGTLKRLKRTLKRFKKLLNENGQILIIVSHIQTFKYWHAVYTPQYNGQIGIPFKILFLNAYYLSRMVSKYGFRATILDKDISTGIRFYLIKLVKD